MSKQNKWITMEPELEAMAGHLSPLERLDLARAMERWPHQLRLSAYLLIQAANAEPHKRKRLKRVNPKELLGN